MSSGSAMRPSGHGLPHLGDARLVAVEEVGLLGAHHPRGHEVDPHLGRPLDRDGLGEVDQPRLGRAVGRGLRRGPQPADAADVDDRSAGVLLLHPVVGALRAEDRREQVEGDDPLGETGRGRGACRPVATRRRCSPARRGDRAGRRPRRPSPTPPRRRGGRRRTRSIRRASCSGWLREQTASVAPASAKRCAIPRPTPLVPPVTSTTMPSKSSSMVMFRPAPHADGWSSAPDPCRTPAARTCRTSPPIRPRRRTACRRTGNRTTPDRRRSLRTSASC